MAVTCSYDLSSSSRHVAMLRSRLSSALFACVAVVSCTACGPSTSVDEAKLAAADFFASGDHAAADACLGVALARLTSELERLAHEASSLRA